MSFPRNDDVLQRTIQRLQIGNLQRPVHVKEQVGQPAHPAMEFGHHAIPRRIRHGNIRNPVHRQRHLADPADMRTVYFGAGRDRGGEVDIVQRNPLFVSPLAAQHVGAHVPDNVIAILSGGEHRSPIGPEGSIGRRRDQILRILFIDGEVVHADRIREFRLQIQTGYQHPGSEHHGDPYLVFHIHEG